MFFLVFLLLLLLVHINSFVHVHAAMQGLSFGIPREYEGDQSIGGTPIREILGMETVFDALQRVRADVVGYGGRKVGWVHGWVAGWPGEAVHFMLFYCHLVRHVCIMDKSLRSIQASIQPQCGNFNDISMQTSVTLSIHPPSHPRLH